MGDYYAGLTDDQWTELVWGHGLSGKTPAIVAYSLFHYKDLTRTIGHLGHAYVALIGDVFAFGALKYGRVGDWRSVPLDHHLQAAGRHFHAWLQDPTSTDLESGLTHAAHFFARAVMIQWLRQNRSTDVAPR
jgi:hypothetical protein